MLSLDQTVGKMEDDGVVIIEALPRYHQPSLTLLIILHFSNEEAALMLWNNLTWCVSSMLCFTSLSTAQARSFVLPIKNIICSESTGCGLSRDRNQSLFSTFAVPMTGMRSICISTAYLMLEGARSGEFVTKVTPRHESRGFDGELR